ncbi:hypothetical protein QBC43DRAFT_297175 [Cladorrhinum sp. PSN259]|nr:hypothetical protein QBC43DRAFT_297175 [Cladorrhinum sp. PSN259]
MDRFFFAKNLKNGYCLDETEKTQYLEVLNYSDPSHCATEWKSLDIENDFHQFLTRMGKFTPPSLPETISFHNGLRLVLQQKAQNPRTFEPHVIPFPKDDYEALVREMQLPLRSLEASSAVGPFFWWSISSKQSDDPLFQIIFRKSDGNLNGKSSGWEMMLSYSFKTRITSGFVKATEESSLDRDILPDLKDCCRPIAHPLFLPFLMVYKALSSENDKKQRDLREKIRKLEFALSARYHDKVDRAQTYAAERDLELDAINKELTACHCQVMQKRPQAWQNVVKRLQEAAKAFWESLSDDVRDMPGFQELHQCIVSRLEFIQIKLESLESYTHVSLERLCLQREVMHGIINHRESRLSLEIAVQQQMLADSTRRDGMSMKTLTLVGALFLPGTFLSSMFSMPFFDFSSDMNGPVSKRLWIYFVLLIPVTVIVLGAWLVFDKRSKTVTDQDLEQAEYRMEDLEQRITARIRKKTGVRLGTKEISDSSS